MNTGSNFRYRWWGALTLALAAQVGVAAAETMTVKLPGVTDVSIQTVGDTQIRQGDEEQLIVEAEPKVLSALAIKVSGGKLVIAAKDDIRTKQDIKYRITVKRLQRLAAEASGDVALEPFKGDSLRIIASGSGDISAKRLELSQQLNIDKSGSGEINIKGGSAAGGDFRLTGSGDIDSSGFVVQDLKAELSGSGEMKLNAAKTLKADLSGAGDISYRGNAKLTQSVTGAGAITHR